MPERQVAPKSDLDAKLAFDGALESGSAKNETRTITGLTVTNNAKVPVAVEIEEEASKQVFAGVIRPGNTAEIPTKPLTQYWNTEVRPRPRWDGLNIRWKEPA